jgi:hypothetical protein
LCNVLYKENARRNSQREKYYLFWMDTVVEQGKTTKILYKLKIKIICI